MKIFPSKTKSIDKVVKTEWSRPKATKNKRNFGILHAIKLIQQHQLGKFQ